MCWATAAGQPRSLADFLAAGAHCSRADLEEVFQCSLQTGEPFGELLTRRGLVTPVSVRASLLEQTIDAIQTLSASWSLETGDYECRERSDVVYDEAFTSGPLELLERSVAEWVLPLSLPSLGSGDLGTSAEVTGALLFAYDDAAGLPVPVAATGAGREMRLDEAVSIGRCAQALVKAPTLRVAGIHAFAAMAHNEGAGVLVRAAERGLEAYLVADRSQCAAALARIWAERVTVGAQTHP